MPRATGTSVEEKQLPGAVPSSFIAAQQPANHGSYLATLLTPSSPPPRTPNQPTPITTTAGCYRCLALDHQVQDCRDPVRCRNCRGSGHRQLHCKMPVVRRQTPMPRPSITSFPSPARNATPPPSASPSPAIHYPTSPPRLPRTPAVTGLGSLLSEPPRARVVIFASVERHIIPHPILLSTPTTAPASPTRYASPSPPAPTSPYSMPAVSPTAVPGGAPLCQVGDGASPLADPCEHVEHVTSEPSEYDEFASGEDPEGDSDPSENSDNSNAVPLFNNYVDIHMLQGHWHAVTRYAYAYLSDGVAANPAPFIQDAMESVAPGLGFELLPSSCGAMLLRFADTNDCDYAVTLSPVLLNGERLNLEHSADTGNRFYDPPEWLAHLNVKDYPLEHWFLANIRAAFRRFGNVVEIDQSCLTGFDYSSVPVLVELSNPPVTGHATQERRL